MAAQQPICESSHSQLATQVFSNLPSRVKPLSSPQFGRLTVLSFSGVGKHHQSRWTCRCECGAIKDVNGRSLEAGTTTSCGNCVAHMTDDDYDARIKGKIFKSVKRSCSGCWEWMKSRDKDGYGSIQVRGVRRRAHIEAYRILVGTVPEGLCVCHRCDNPSCVNPDHLFIGSHQDNSDDKCNKGRQSRMDGRKHRLPSMDKKRATKNLEIDGEIRTQAEWSMISGIPPGVICRRLKRGWSIKEAVWKRSQLACQ